MYLRSLVAVGCSVEVGEGSVVELSELVVVEVSTGWSEGVVGSGGG